MAAQRPHPVPAAQAARATASPQADETRHLAEDLALAAGRGELRLHFQPVVSLATGQTVGVEALLRWQHPRRGLLPPGAFLAEAEASGQIVPIGAWVIQEACRQARRWRDAHGADAPLPVQVNLSGRQVESPGLVELVAEALAAAGVPGSDLAFEVTETELIRQAEPAVATLRALRALGVRLMLDDFGVGYSSLSYLKLFPVDVVKLDRSFVRGLGESLEDEAIVAGVVSVCHGLGRRVLAEGVETEAQARRALALGCSLGQGYLWGRPQAEIVPGRCERIVLGTSGRPAAEVAAALHDEDRLEAVRQTGLLGSPPEEVFDSLGRFARRALDVPVAAISLVGHDGYFLKTSLGLPGPGGALREAPLSYSICQHVVATGEPLVIEDARRHPLSMGTYGVMELGVVAYAGMPLTTRDGLVLGVCFVIDRRPRVWTTDQLAWLTRVAQAATTEMELRIARRTAERREVLLAAQQDVLEMISARAPLAATLEALLHDVEGGGAVGAVSLVDRDRRLLRLAAAPSLPGDVARVIDGLAVDADPAGFTAPVATGRTAIAVDLAADLADARLAATLRDHGLRSVWSVPVRDGAAGRLGMLTLFRDRPRQPSRSELRLLEQLGRLVSVAVRESAVSS